MYVVYRQPQPLKITLASSDSVSICIFFSSLRKKNLHFTQSTQDLFQHRPDNELVIGVEGVRSPSFLTGHNLSLICQGWVQCNNTLIHDGQSKCTKTLS